MRQMKEKRENCERQAAAKHKQKANLDAAIMQYSGLWHNVGDLEENIAQLDEKQKKVAIITQIKY